jgi:hypothetical protein
MLNYRITLLHKNSFKLGLHSASRSLIALTELQHARNVNNCLNSNLGTGATCRVLRQPKKRTKGFELELGFLLEDKFKEFVHITHFYMGFAKHAKGRNRLLNDGPLQYNGMLCHIMKDSNNIVAKERKRILDSVSTATYYRAIGIHTSLRLCVTTLF